MSLTDVTYFVGELNLPNTDKTETAENIQLYIDEYEPEFLKLILGDALYAQFIAGITPVEVQPPTDPATFEPIEQKWLDLKNVLFVISGTAKVSPVANYIYFHIVRRSTYANSGIGLTQGISENSTIIDSKIECSRAWNKMNKLSFNVYKYLKTNVSVYGALPYDLRFCDNYYLLYYFDWSFWWNWFPVLYRKCIPEIYQPINLLGI